MENFVLRADQISKSFSHGRKIFSGIGLELCNGNILAITGENGSGKSTLLKILAGILSPSTGKIFFSVSGKEISSDRFNAHIGFVSPYLTLYEEFTPAEHLRISASMRGKNFDEERCNFLLEQFRLYKRRLDAIKTFSSGMKQRMKYVLALQHDPEILFLDEPTTNIDIAGIEVINQEIVKSATAGRGIIIATNEERERALCTSEISIA